MVEECDKEENVAVNGAAATTVWKEDCRTFRSMSRIRPVIARSVPNDKYPVSSSHGPLFVSNVSTHYHIIS